MSAALSLVTATKRCCSCRIEKPVEAYGRHRGYPDGLRKDCRECHNIAERGYEESAREHYVRRRAEREAQRTDRRCARCRKIKPKTEFGAYRTRAQKPCYTCKSCVAKRALKAYRANPEKWRASAQRSKAKTKEFRRAFVMLRQVQRRAKEKGIPFALSEADINIPTHCPILGILLELNSRTTVPGSPTVDRLLPALGYVPGNVTVISHRANSIKYNASSDELRRVADWIDARLVELTRGTT